MGTKVYDSANVNLIIAGVPISNGLADGEFLRIEQESDDFGDAVGTDGEVTRFRSRDRRATATVLLMNTSEHNQFLSALSSLDKLTPNGAGVVPFFAQIGASIYEATEAWIQKPPDVSFDREPTPREWTIRLANLLRNDSGDV